MVGRHSCVHRCAWLYFVEGCIDYRVSYTCDLQTQSKDALLTFLMNSIWTKYTFIAIPGSMALWFLYLPIVAYIGPAISSSVFPEYTGIVPQVWGNVNFWLYLILVPFLCNLRDFAWKL